MICVEVILKIESNEVDNFVQIDILLGGWEIGVICPLVDFQFVGNLGGPLKAGRNNKH